MRPECGWVIPTGLRVNSNSLGAYSSFYLSFKYFIDKISFSASQILTQLFVTGITLASVTRFNARCRLTSTTVDLVLVVPTVSAAVAHRTSRYAAAVVADKAVVVAFLVRAATRSGISCKGETTMRETWLRHYDYVNDRGYVKISDGH